MSITITQSEASPLLAASSPQKLGEDYVFQVDDQLGKLAEKYYGTPLAYPALIEATNIQAVKDDSYTAIADPNRILTGQKLFVLDFEEIRDGSLKCDIG